MPDDSRRFGIDYSRLTGIPSYSRGVGGFVESVQIPAIVMFRETNGLRRFYRLQIDVMPDRRELRETPSLLGQDILAHWRTLHDPTRGTLQATVVAAHGTYRL